MQTTQPASTVTIITIASAVLGYLASSTHNLFAILIAPILIIPKYIQIISSHTWIKLAQFNSTTFIFGLIVGYCWQGISQYLSQQESLQVPTFQIYLCLLVIYHYFQFQMVNNFHHSTLSWESFLLYHSKPYFLATCFMLTEHFITKYLLGFSYKDSHILIPLGIMMTVAGESLRIAAFFTCRHNFTHLVRYRKVAGHQLVTNGVYSIFRHPSYTGYFYFSIGSQILLGNIISFFAFFYVLSRFFEDRIDDEQNLLARFFPQYIQYRKNTYILIPFVKDPVLEGKAYQYQYYQ